MRYTHLATPSLLVALSLVAPVGSARAHDGHGQDHAAPPDARALTEVVRTGSGDDVFQSVPGWWRAPAGRDVLGPTHGGIAVDGQGNLYFTMDGGPSGILVYAPDGAFLRGLGDEKLTGIHGLCIADEGREQFLFAAHLKGRRALKLKLDGTIVWAIGYEQVKESGKYQEEGQFSPTAVAVGPDRSVYVADGYGQNWIHRFDAEQKYVSSFGGPGTEPGQLRVAHGMALDTRKTEPLLLVCDRENRRLQHFDLDGKLVGVVTEGLRRPCSVSFHGGRVAVAELEARVTILDEENRPVAHLGDNPDPQQWANYNVAPPDWKPGIFTAPHGVSFDRQGDLYVMDWNASGRVSKLERVRAGEK